MIHLKLIEYNDNNNDGLSNISKVEKRDISDEDEFSCDPQQYLKLHSPYTSFPKQSLYFKWFFFLIN